MDLWLVYTACARGENCSFGEVFATDGPISANKLAILEDDKPFFNPTTSR